MSAASSTKSSAAFVCDCSGLARTACAELPFYKKHDGKQYCVLHYPGEDKGADFDEALQRKLNAENFNFIGVWFPAVGDFGGFTFTTPVNFSHAEFSAGVSFDSAEFNAEVSFDHAQFMKMGRVFFDHSTFRADVSFDHVRFSADVSFGHATFRADADFGHAEFHGRAVFNSVTFNAGTKFGFAKFLGLQAEFIAVTFKAETYFSFVTFEPDVAFAYATFSAETYFTFTTFCKGAYFSSATFNAGVSFIGSTFIAEAYFIRAIFKDYIKFEGANERQIFGDKSSFNLQFARIEMPNRFSFHTVTLRPYWFVNVDASKFEFINVDWKWRKLNLNKLSWNPRNTKTKKEIKSLLSEYSLPAHFLLERACRNLAVNAEEHHLYEDASRFRHMAMDARRLESWRGHSFWTLNWLYWFASGYGEEILRALVVFVVIWVSFAFFYSRPEIRCPTDMSDRADCVGWDITDKTKGFFNSFLNSAVYTIEAMTLQKPEPRPKSPPARLAVMLCTVLGPLQAALLALAIRRKFMR